MSHETLEARATRLRAIIDTPSEKEAAAKELARVEQEITDAREAEGKAAAEQRLADIAREHEDGVAALYAAETRLSATAAQYRGSMEQVNASYAGLSRLRAEASALSDRFSVPMPMLDSVVPPASREQCLAASATVQVASAALADLRHVRPPTEPDETGLRTRRTYREVDGSDGFTIIHRAGLKPWAELTLRQREMLAAREEQRGREATQWTPPPPSDVVPTGSSGSGPLSGLRG